VNIKVVGFAPGFGKPFMQDFFSFNFCFVEKQDWSQDPVPVVAAAGDPNVKGILKKSPGDAGLLSNEAQHILFFFFSSFLLICRIKATTPPMRWRDSILRSITRGGRRYH
jgi:hypothetical protein